MGDGINSPCDINLINIRCNNLRSYLQEKSLMQRSKVITMAEVNKVMATENFFQENEPGPEIKLFAHN